MKHLILIIMTLVFALGTLPAMAQELDRDGDGLSNKEDACPFRAGPHENKGCPLTTTENLAPNPPAPAKDSDGDGLPDSDDQCPTASGPRENRGCPANDASSNPDTNGDGTPDSSGGTSNVDTDGDGTGDNDDQCPIVSGPRENRGCPVDSAPGSVAPVEPPAFSPPALPIDGCYVTAVSSSNVNVRKTPDMGADVVGYLMSGVVYAAEGYVTTGTDVWFVMKTYEDSTGETGYSSASVLLSSTCAETTAAKMTSANNLKQMGIGIYSPENPTIEYCVYLEVEEVGVFKEVCYEVEVPEGCTVTSSEAGVFTVDCGGGVVTVNPLFDDLPAEGLQVPTRDPEIGVALQIMYGPGDGGNRSTAEYCVYEEVEEAGVFKEVCHEIEIPEGCWLETAEAGVFITKCRPEIGGEGIWLVGQGGDDNAAGAGSSSGMSAGKVSYSDLSVMISLELCASGFLVVPDDGENKSSVENLLAVTCLDNTVPLDLPRGVMVGTGEPVNPLDLMIAPASPDPTAQLSLNFSKIEFEYKPQSESLELDMRGTKLGSTQTHDDGSTTVEYCIYVELYEVGVFNEVCYEVEIPENCVLTTSEAGVYTVVCEDDGVISVNPDLEDLPALDMTVQPDTQGYILIELLPVKLTDEPDPEAILIALLLPAVQN